MLEVRAGKKAALSFQMKATSRLLLAALAVGLPACSAPPAPAAEEQSAASPALPTVEFELADLEGQLFGPADFEGEYLLIEFWATWCGPCHLQADILEDLYPKLREKGVEFVAVSLGEPAGVVRDFVAERPFPYQVLLDPDDYFAINYGVFVLPTIVVVDREGEVHYAHEGISTAERLIEVVDDLVAGGQATAGL